MTTVDTTSIAADACSDWENHSSILSRRSRTRSTSTLRNLWPVSWWPQTLSISKSSSSSVKLIGLTPCKWNSTPLPSLVVKRQTVALWLNEPTQTDWECTILRDSTRLVRQLISSLSWPQVLWMTRLWLKSRAIRLKWTPFTIWKSISLMMRWTTYWRQSWFSNRSSLTRTRLRRSFTVKRSIRSRHLSALAPPAYLLAIQTRFS